MLVSNVLKMLLLKLSALPLGKILEYISTNWSLVSSPLGQSARNPSYHSCTHKCQVSGVKCVKYARNRCRRKFQVSSVKSQVSDVKCQVPNVKCQEVSRSVKSQGTVSRSVKMQYVSSAKVPVWMPGPAGSWPVGTACPPLTAWSYWSRPP